MRRYIPQQAEFGTHPAKIPELLMVQGIDTDPKRPCKVGRKTDMRVDIRIEMLHVRVEERRVGPQDRPAKVTIGVQNAAAQNKVKSRLTRQILCFYYITVTFQVACKKVGCALSFHPEK